MKTVTRTRAAVAAATLAAASLAAALTGSGTAQAAGGPAQPAAAGLAIAVHPDQVGQQLRAGFVGLSFGAATVAADDYSATDLAGYLKTLGPSGTLRVGGNSGDGTFWTSTNEAAPSWATSGTITPAKLQSLAAIAHATGWKVILAVNLKHPDAPRAADEAKYAQQIFGRSLLAIEVGNEPNFYEADADAYHADFETYAAAIRAAVPGMPLTGPEAETNHSSWLGAFATADAAHPDVSLISDHTYPTSACGGQVATIPQLLGTASVQYENTNAQAALSAARQLHVPAAMTETNSTVCAGTAGVSDTLASALWSLDYNLLLAQDGMTSAEFMDGTNAAGCDPYTPLCPTTGDLTPRPLYYGLLATELVGSGEFVALDNPDSADIRAYAVRESGHLTIVLDNVQDPASHGATTVNLALGLRNLHCGTATTLSTTSPAGLAATTDITLGGQQVGAHGAFPTPQHTSVSVRHGAANVTVQAGSAVIIRFS
ncbi:putative lipoprotein [Catenulispora acidiphila DSM 44928]|uniref:Putative lipoprotein n=1 Tax=Catenulispora acidiphila (strain DSM 44928 / JCM 14897 / NBRC 102108 / NRRL B-24433 / ID139908) TaxID=479433 RepID=C7QJU2_CATAD|nr:glycosyl hydrolase family 79 C-terminal domain-containing protein [Catenulispora acidiphila]ACU73180.1 putative lipoprotein [Catenulispora acidiphila DSM 44928]